METCSPQPLYKFTKLQECKWVLCPLCSKQSSEFNQLILLAKYCSSQDARHVVLNYEVPFTTSAWYVFFFFLTRARLANLWRHAKEISFLSHIVRSSSVIRKVAKTLWMIVISEGAWFQTGFLTLQQCVVWFFFHPTPHPSVFSSMHHHSAPLSPTNIFFFISFALAPRLLLPLKCLLWEIVCKGLSFLSTSSSEVLLFPDIYCAV